MDPRYQTSQLLWVLLNLAAHLDPSVLMDLTSEGIGSPHGNENLKSFSQGQINCRSDTDGAPHIKIGRFGRYFSYKLKQLLISLVHMDER